MHNLHFVRTEAKGPKTAIIDVESAIENWGNENNWRRVFGCVNKRGKITIVDEESRWADITYKQTKGILEKAYYTPYPMEQEAFDRVLKGELPKDFEWYLIEKYAKWQLKKYWTNVEKSSGKFDIWKHQFGDWDLSDVGLTDLGMSDAVSQWLKDGDDGKDYIVFVDMHS